MKNKIIDFLKDYISKNNLFVKINYYKKDDWYELLLMSNDYLYKNRFVILEYKSSTVIYLNNDRYDFSDDKFDKEFNDKILIRFK